MISSCFSSVQFNIVNCLLQNPHTKKMFRIISVFSGLNYFTLLHVFSIVASYLRFVSSILLIIQGHSFVVWAYIIQINVLYNAHSPHILLNMRPLKTLVLLDICLITSKLSSLNTCSAVVVLHVAFYFLVWFCNLEFNTLLSILSSIYQWLGLERDDGLTIHHCKDKAIFALQCKSVDYI